MASNYVNVSKITLIIIICLECEYIEDYLHLQLVSMDLSSVCRFNDSQS
jgi:hypothetical protein